MIADSQPSNPQHHEQGTPKSGAPRLSFFGAVTQALNIIGTVLILIMAIAVNADVLGRNIFNHPIPGVLEFMGWSIVAIVFLQMANTLRVGRHVSNDVFISKLVKARPRLAAGLFAMFDLTGAVLMTLIVIFIWPLLEQNYTEGFYAGTAGVVEIPIWPFILSVFIGAAATGFQVFVDALQDLRRASGRA